MGVGVDEVVVAFEYLYENLLNREYAKSAGFEDYSERELHHIVRAFLLGYFWDDMRSELASSLPGASTGVGRIDFVVGKVAVELAVRKRGSRGKRKLCAAENETEVKKLLRWKGPGLLVLYDFSAPSLTMADLARYRTLPTLGSGNWHTSSFQVAYFHREGRPREPKITRLRIRSAPQAARETA